MRVLRFLILFVTSLRLVSCNTFGAEPFDRTTPNRTCRDVLKTLGEYAIAEQKLKAEGFEPSKLIPGTIYFQRGGKIAVRLSSGSLKDVIVIPNQQV
jgi:hypothetical protein